MSHQSELNEAREDLRERQTIAQQSAETFNDLVAEWKQITARANAAKAEMQQRIQEMNDAQAKVSKLERAAKTRSNLTAGIQFNRKTGTP